MNNTTKAPFVQLSIFKTDDAVNDAVISAYGNDFTNDGYLIIPSMLPGFRQTMKPECGILTKNFGTAKKLRIVNKEITTIRGTLKEYDPAYYYICPECGSVLDLNGSSRCSLTHLPIGNSYTKLTIDRQRLRCMNKGCGYNYTFEIDFKADGHLLTQPLVNYMRDLLSLGMTLKEISQLTGVDQNIVKDIDKKRLEEKYTVNGDGKQLRKPEKQATLLGIDEFLLHDGRNYATIIIDLETGHVLYLAHTKQKKVVYDFMDFVGSEWMSNVKAVASDMNADYGSAFQERYPEIKVVYDHFHIVKNFNEKVINEVKKDEVKRLESEGDMEAAASLKGSKYILMSNRSTLHQKDDDAKDGKVISRSGTLFEKAEIIQKGGSLEQYEEILAQNELLCAADIVKEKLIFAYEANTELKMKRRINSIISICDGTGNKHFVWFAKLLRTHYDGIIAHAIYHISTGKVEGTNQMIKTLRRKSYGIPDDDYFFLKIIDASRN